MNGMRLRGDRAARFFVSLIFAALLLTACVGTPVSTTDTVPTAPLTTATPIATSNVTATTPAAPRFLTPSASPLTIATPSLPATQIRTGSPTVAGTLAPALTPIPAPDFDAAAVYDRVAPAVVTVVNTQRRGQSRVPPANSLASGVVYDTQGHLLTNSRVTQGAQKLDIVLFGGKIISGTVIGRDTLSDLAVVQIDPKAAPAVAASGDANTVRVGQTVLAFGSPMELTESVSHGVISGMHRSLDDANDLLQVSAPLAPGSTGGPVVNGRSEIIGITVRTLRDDRSQRLGFAVPINTAVRLAQRIVASGDLRRVSIGAQTEMLTPTRATELGVPVRQGAYISAATPGGPAERAGIRQGDIVTAVNSTPLTPANPLDDALLDFAPKQSVMLTVNRGGTDRTIAVTLIERP